MNNLNEYRLLKKYGEWLGRRGIVEYTIVLAERIRENANDPKLIIEILGELECMARACAFDSYWNEKRKKGAWHRIGKAVKVLEELEKKGR